MAPLYTSLATGEAEAVANKAKKKTKATYAHLEASHHFVPFAVESVRVARLFLQDLSRHLKNSSYFRAPTSPPSDPEDLSGSTKGQHGCHPGESDPGLPLTSFFPT